MNQRVAKIYLKPGLTPLRCIPTPVHVKECMNSKIVDVIESDTMGLST